MEIKLAQTDEDILRCREVLLSLRPQVTADRFLPMVKEMQQAGYQVAYLEQDGKAVAAVGFQYMQFLYNGKHFYVNDLSTLPAYRGKGYATKLLDFVAVMAKERGYDVVTLDSGFHRQKAHKVYLSSGYEIASLHFSKPIS